MTLLNSIGKVIQFAVETKIPELGLTGLYASTIRGVAYKEGLAILTIDRIVMTTRPNNWYTDQLTVFEKAAYDCTVYQLLHGLPKDIRSVSCTDWKLLD